MLDRKSAEDFADFAGCDFPFRFSCQADENLLY